MAPRSMLKHDTEKVKSEKSIETEEGERNKVRKAKGGGQPRHIMTVSELGCNTLRPGIERIDERRNTEEGKGREDK